MLWEAYYDKLGDWATSTAVSRLSKLESFGPTDEIIDAINQIGFDDEKGATRLLKKAYQFSLIDTSRKKRAATVVKYTCIADAQSYISKALDAWKMLDIPEKNKQPLRGIWPNISNSTMWQNYLFEGFFTNMMVKRQIRKVMQNIETAIHRIRQLRCSL